MILIAAIENVVPIYFSLKPNVQVKLWLLEQLTLMLEQIHINAPNRCMITRQTIPFNMYMLQSAARTHF
jgi:hypothetical protein